MKPEDVVIRENREPLVVLDPTEFDLKPQYFKQGLTTESRVWLREGVVEKLRAVRAMLPAGWSVRIWDGWRPLELQAKLHDQVLHWLRSQHSDWDTAAITAASVDFIHPSTTNPPAPHSTGGAVDLTLVDASGQGLNFGTGYDDFTDRAAADYFAHHAAASKEDQEAKTNRQQLTFLMESQDFAVNPAEWWHWEFGTSRWAAAKGVEIARYGTTVPSKYESAGASLE